MQESDNEISSLDGDSYLDGSVSETRDSIVSGSY